jgi:cysteine sulfinate desulfinase/cysteine desulfurase-like protein
MDVNALGVDLLSISAHKIYGPKGTGALYVRSWNAPRTHRCFMAGTHERDRRPGTENVGGHRRAGHAHRAIAQRDAVIDTATDSRCYVTVSKILCSTSNPACGVNGRRDMRTCEHLQS